MDDVLRYDEKAVMSLRRLFGRYGYIQCRMSRFEEYGLYAENKAFLSSDNIITFTDEGGKLMALRPDVTLSIIKGVREGSGLKKLCYNENVYRPEGGKFREMMQVGLECIGDVDAYSTGEVMMLARRSLEMLGGSSCLDISHMGFIGGLLKSAPLTPEVRISILKLISEKNVHSIDALCEANGLDEGFRGRVRALASLYGSYDEAIDELRSISCNDETEAAISELDSLFNVLDGFGVTGGVNLDFSIVNNLNYYSGVIFQGFIEGIPSKVLSGGRYDALPQKLGKNSGAVGFAVYLNLLERLAPQHIPPELDILLLYGGGESPEALSKAVAQLTANGESVRVQRSGQRHDNDTDFHYGRRMLLSEGRLTTID